MTTKKYWQEHKGELVQKHHEYVCKNRDKLNAHRREYCRQNRAKINQQQGDYVRKNRRKITMATAEYHRRYRKENRERLSIQAKKRTLRIKTDVLTRYGGGKCACVKCGFSDIRALSIDHINNDGAKARATIKPNRSRAFSGLEFYVWLRKNDYPKGLQTLCMNCQWVKRMGGVE